MKNEEENALRYLKHRILTHYNEAQEILNGGMPLPRMAILHPTYVCNHNCVGCDFRYQNNELKTILSEKDANKILDELIKAGIQAVEFSGGGEALLAPNISQMIKKLRDNGIAVGILTNGSKLEGEILDTIIRNCTYLRVSLEAGSNEVFMKVKNVKSNKEFSRIVDNIKNAVQLKKKLGKSIDISIKFTVGRINYMDMEKAIQLAIKLGVDSIQFKLYENVDAVQLYEQKNPEKLQSVASKLEELKKSYGDKIIILGDLRKTRLRSRCWLSPIITLVDALGDIYLCSYYRHRMKTHCIGNLLKDDFKTIWYGKRHREAIENIKAGECDLYDCRFHFYNYFMKKLIQDSNDALKFI